MQDILFLSSKMKLLFEPYKKRSIYFQCLINGSYLNNKRRAPCRLCYFQELSLTEKYDLFHIFVHFVSDFIR